MGRPTLAEQLAKAAEAGDLEKVQQLASKLANSKPKKAKKKKVKKQPELTIEYPQEEEAKEPVENDPNNFLAPIKRKSAPGEKVITEDGKEYVRMRTVPFIIKKNRKNKWNDDGQEELADAEFDKKVHKNNIKIPHRDPVEKISVRCVRCKQKKLVWPGEVFNSNYSCDECLLDR